VLLDAVMPKMDGFEACAIIRSDPRYTDLPIIMTTALQDAESVDNAFRAGATDYLTKPMKSVDLLARVRSTLNLKVDLDRRKKRERELRQHEPFQFDDIAPQHGSLAFDEDQPSRTTMT
jgi:PleD family two-component response regulator